MTATERVQILNEALTAALKANKWYEGASRSYDAALENAIKHLEDVLKREKAKAFDERPQVSYIAPPIDMRLDRIEDRLKILEEKPMLCPDQMMCANQKWNMKQIQDLRRWVQEIQIGVHTIDSKLKDLAK